MSQALTVWSRLLCDGGWNTYPALGIWIQELCSLSPLSAIPVVHCADASDDRVAGEWRSAGLELSGEHRASAGKSSIRITSTHRKNSSLF